jgi:hypothetical protein
MTGFAEKANKAEKGVGPGFSVRKNCVITAQKVFHSAVVDSFFSTYFALYFAAKSLCDGFFRLIRFFSMKTYDRSAHAVR